MIRSSHPHLISIVFVSLFLFNKKKLLPSSLLSLGVECKNYLRKHVNPTSGVRIKQQKPAEMIKPLLGIDICIYPYNYSN